MSKWIRMQALWIRAPLHLVIPSKIPALENHDPEQKNASISGQDRTDPAIFGSQALNKRGTGWCLGAPKRASGGAAMKFDDVLVTAFETDGAIRIVMLARSMHAALPQ